MNQRQRFIKKIAYACVIAALLLPLSWLSQPATTASQGGKLAQMRKAHHLSQATLGEIDPASETIKLATLGMRGVAANILWQKAHDYEKREDWVGLSATLEQIVRLQPNFITVWIYQGWNLSYNISVQFDDYRDRYYWVIRGIDFLNEGTTYNEKEPRLTSEIGWMIGHKIGRADERLQYRRLFRDDDDFHGSRTRDKRDNWLVGREYMLRAQAWVDQEGLPVKGKSPLLFHSQPVMCLISYAEALEEEGTFGEVAKAGWRKAADAWEQFSNRDLPTQYNVFIRLGDKERFDQQAEEALAKLEKMIPQGLREKIFTEKLAALTLQEREAYEAAREDRTPEQVKTVYSIEGKLWISHIEIADRIPGEDHIGALEAAEEAAYAEFMSNTIAGERDIINYDYWRRRCLVEPQDKTLEARKKIYDADQAFSAADIEEAHRLYVAGLETWREVLDANKFLVEDASHVEELAYSISNFNSLLHQLDQPFPDPFILQDVLDANERFTGVTFPGAQQSTPEPEESAEEANESTESGEPNEAETPVEDTTTPSDDVPQPSP